MYRPLCYAAKLEAHVQKQIAAKPSIVPISMVYGEMQDDGKVIPCSLKAVAVTVKPRGLPRRCC